MTKFQYLDSRKLQAARELMANRNWQASTQVSFVERVAALQIAIDWGQGRVEVPETVQEIISDLHIGSGSAGYSDSDRINRILAFCAAKHVGERSNHGTRFEVIYGELTGAGLDKLIEWLQAQPEATVPGLVHPVDENLSLHPNVRRALKAANVVDKDEISAVLSHCHFMVNISGGTQSGWVHAAAERMRRLGGADALRADDSKANEALMERDRAWRR